MEAPYFILLFLCFSGIVTGRRSRGQLLREQLYLETKANQTGSYNTTTQAPPSVSVLPPPSVEGMDYEGSGHLDLFWKLTARAVTPSTVPVTLPIVTTVSTAVPSTTVSVTAPSSTTTVSTTTGYTAPVLTTTKKIAPSTTPTTTFAFPVTVPFTPVITRSTAIPTTARVAQTTVTLNDTSRPYTASPFHNNFASSVDSTDNATRFLTNGSERITGHDTKVNFGGWIDTVFLSTFSYFFGGGSNDTESSSHNETDRIAYGSTPYAGGTISWHEEILSWFETEIRGKQRKNIFA
jgi:hypothetical protein